MRKISIRKGSLIDRITNRTLLANKVCSILMILLGYAATRLLGDSTVLILMLLMGLPIFFAKENVID